MKNSSLCVLIAGAVAGLVFLSSANGQCPADLEPQCDAPCYIEPTDIATEEFQTFYIYLEKGYIYDISITAVYDEANPQDPENPTDVDVYLDDAEVNPFPDVYTNQFAADAVGDEFLEADFTEETEGLCLAVAMYGWSGGRYEALFDIAESSLNGQTPPVAKAVQPQSFTCDTVETASKFKMGMSVAKEYIPYVCQSAQIASFIIPVAKFLALPCEKWDSIQGVAEFVSSKTVETTKSIAMVNCWEEPVPNSGASTPVAAFTAAAQSSGITVEMETTGTDVLTQGIKKYGGNAKDSLCTSSLWYAAAYKSGEQTDVYDAQTTYLVKEILGENVDEAEFVTVDATESTDGATLGSYWRNREGILLAQSDQGPENENWKIRFCEISVASTSAAFTGGLNVIVAIGALILMIANVA